MDKDNDPSEEFSLSIEEAFTLLDEDPEFNALDEARFLETVSQMELALADQEERQTPEFFGFMGELLSTFPREHYEDNQHQR